MLFDDVLMLDNSGRCGSKTIVDRRQVWVQSSYVSSPYTLDYVYQKHVS